MKTRELLEMGGEFMPRKKGTPDRLARDLLDAAKGDAEIASKMAHNFLKSLLASIEEQGTFTGAKDAGRGRPEQSFRQQPPAKGYEPDAQRPRHRNYGRA